MQFILKFGQIRHCIHTHLLRKAKEIFGLEPNSVQIKKLLLKNKIWINIWKKSLQINGTTQRTVRQKNNVLQANKERKNDDIHFLPVRIVIWYWGLGPGPGRGRGGPGGCRAVLNIHNKTTCNAVRKSYRVYAVFRIRDISGSGSADLYLWLTDPDPDPARFVSNLQDANKK